MDFFIQIQLNCMMMLGSICCFIFLFLLFMKIENRDKKQSFLQIAFFITLLLFSDRLAYLYRGDESTAGYWMVRISNFLVFFSILMSENGFNNYLFSLVRAGEENTVILRISRLLAGIGVTLLIISQFTGLYYTFDQTNHYVRSRAFVFCYAVPLVIILLQMIFVTKYRRIFSTIILISLYLFLALPTIAGVVQIFFYGASLTSISMGISAILLYFLALHDQNYSLTVASGKALKMAYEMQEQSNDLLNQTVEALASAVDAKDAYTHGHSNRVAKYARRIAELSGMSDRECQEIYLCGLLHDIGKIGIQDSLISKPSKLTEEEYAIIQQHPALGERILSKITLAPLLSVAARSHHERFDGTGYPDRLKGDDIPAVGRIIAVADAYDAMSSKRSYRGQIPQQNIREELVNGIGTQFDPEYAKIMIHLLDMDVQYRMKEQQEDETLTSGLYYDFEEYRSDISAGIQITDRPVTITLRYTTPEDGGQPTLLFYDSSDARYYKHDSTIRREMDFIEYGSLDLDGKVTSGYVRKVQQKTSSREITRKQLELHIAEICLVKQEDHLLVQITTSHSMDEVIFALHDASRFLYTAVTGSYCSVDILKVSIAKKSVEKNHIPRIAEKITYIGGAQGDIPNLQVDGWRTDHSQPIALKKTAEVTFHTMSLPSSRRIWHCPIICLFTSEDGTIGGSGYKELCLIRLDGEVWSEYDEIVNSPVASRDEHFENWNTWKQHNKDGVSCSLKVQREGNKVLMRVENSGVTTINHTTLPKDVEKVAFFLTGDQCAITDIRIKQA